MKADNFLLDELSRIEAKSNADENHIAIIKQALHKLKLLESEEKGESNDVDEEINKNITSKICKIFENENLFQKLNLDQKRDLILILKENGKEEQALKFLQEIKDDEKLISPMLKWSTSKIILFFNGLSEAEIKHIILNISDEYSGQNANVVFAFFENEIKKQNLPDWMFEILFEFSFNFNYEKLMYQEGYNNPEHNQNGDIGGLFKKVANDEHITIPWKKLWESMLNKSKELEEKIDLLSNTIFSIENSITLINQCDPKQTSEITSLSSLSLKFNNKKESLSRRKMSIDTAISIINDEYDLPKKLKEIDEQMENENCDWQKIFENMRWVEDKTRRIPSYSMHDPNYMAEYFLGPYFKILKKETEKKIHEKSFEFLKEDLNLKEIFQETWSTLKKLKEKEEKSFEEDLLRSLQLIIKIENLSLAPPKNNPINAILKKTKEDIKTIFNQKEEKKWSEISSKLERESQKEKSKLEQLFIEIRIENSIIDKYGAVYCAKSQSVPPELKTFLKNFKDAYHRLQEEEKKEMEETIKNVAITLAAFQHLVQYPNDPSAEKIMEEISTGLDDLKKEFENGQKEWSDRQKACFIAGAICVVVILIALSVVTAGFAAGAGAALYAFIHSAAGIAVLTAAPTLTGALTAHASHKEQKEASKPTVKLHQAGKELVESLEKTEVLKKKKRP